MLAQGVKVVVIINLIIIDHERMIQAFRIIEISKCDDGGQLMPRSSTLIVEVTSLVSLLCKRHSRVY